ncbi:MAG: 16S rRNA (cytosine(1402)-N(4))-methyltransferase, partial [Oscillospiraceae bacterium]|nr:16S rRNA (cytosine(1402)-N(4))-methyltransferase [Oscillospiraceae bacterium]
MEFSHVPVLLKESIEGLNIKPNGVYVDGTAGGGGHSAEILKNLENGKLISIDRDPDAIERVSERFKKEKNSIIIKGCYGDMKSLLLDRGIGEVDGVLLDI